MKATEEVYEFIKDREKCRLTAYRDAAMRWTVGYGATGGSIKQGTVWTQEQADTDLLMRLETISALLEKAVVPDLTQNQFNALVSLVYNIGQGAFRGSTLLRMVNTRQWEAAADEFLKWNKITLAGRKVSLEGLSLRREAERQMFLAAI